jgi:hypothetical protein
MNEFDRKLEFELRLFLDPIASAPAPPRRGRRAQSPPLAELKLKAPETLAAIPVEVFS